MARPVVIRYRRQRGYCLDCGKVFSSRSPEDLPKSRIGPVARAVAGYLHYAARTPFQSVARIFKGLYGMDITPEALAGFDKKLARNGRPLYELIEDMARYSSVVNVDETGWPVGPKNQWLWTYTNPQFALFMIDETRAGEVPQSVLGEKYSGVLCSDCFGAYNRIEAQAKQKCLAHYERGAKDLEKFYPHDEPALLFASSMKDIFKRARQTKRDWLQEKISNQQATQAADRFEKELDALTDEPLENHDGDNLRKRLIKHSDENFTFLRYGEVDPDNNRAERALRPSVVMRKVSYGNNSQTGAYNHQTLITLIETAKLHGAEPLDLMRALACNKDANELKSMLFGLGNGSKVGAQPPEPAAPT